MKTPPLSRPERADRLRRRKMIRQKAARLLILAFVWIGIAVAYYAAFSLFFDTPTEYEMKHSTDRLRREYEALSARYDTLQQVLENVVERDRNVFRILFESEPYDLALGPDAARLATYEALLPESTRALNRSFEEQLAGFASQMAALDASYRRLEERTTALTPDERNAIPAIQPVINKELTLLTASYGMRIHPFYRTLQSHQGVDYTVPEGTRVFATADGSVKEASLRSSTAGRTVVLEHGNGYQTSYAHLDRILVRRGQRVRRGDIIALSGNTGLSLAPHLHYEVRCNGMRVDPIHYFFMELSPEEYRKIIRIAAAGMQSFD